MSIPTELQNLIQVHLSEIETDIRLLKGDGSDRQIYLITGKKDQSKQIVGIYHEDLEENRDFLEITGQMAKIGLPVPKTLAVSGDKSCYLQEYLGEKNLAEQLDEWRDAGEPIEKTISAYQRVLDYLPKIQRELPPLTSTVISKRVMNKAAFLNDIQYFETNFVKRFGFSEFFTEDVRAELLQELINPLDQLDRDYFVYRDFQSRNIMWRDDHPVFIDYQSAYRGSLYYDLASMLYASKSGLDEDARNVLIEYYYKIGNFSWAFETFQRDLYRFVVLRRLRSLGSYGYLSMEKGKMYFLDGIQPTLKELLLLFDTRSVLSRFQKLKEMIQAFDASWEEKSESITS